MNLNYVAADLRNIVSDYHQNTGESDRYASFDYCYNYFKGTAARKLTSDMEKSCHVLGFYLASWGMLRGSSFLLGKSAKYYEPLIDYVAYSDVDLWRIDVGEYDKHNIDRLIGVYQDIREIISPQNTSLTLVTKIMLGVYGTVPAYDSFFKQSFKEIFGKRCSFTSFNAQSLSCIYDFYESNKVEIDRFTTTIDTLSFVKGGPTNSYSKAKIIDMYGFAKTYGNR